MSNELFIQTSMNATMLLFLAHCTLFVSMQLVITHANASLDTLKLVIHVKVCSDNTNSHISNCVR